MSIQVSILVSYTVTKIYKNKNVRKYINYVEKIQYIPLQEKTQLVIHQGSEQTISISQHKNGTINYQNCYYESLLSVIMRYTIQNKLFKHLLCLENIFKNFFIPLLPFLSFLVQSLLQILHFSQKFLNALLIE